MKKLLLFALAVGAWAQVTQIPSAGGGNTSFTQTGTGAVPRTLQNRATDSISVKDFSAIGNGIADDTAAIASACAAAKTVGLALYFPGGTYLTDPITCISQPGMEFYGESPVGSILKARTGNWIIHSQSSTLHSIKIHDLGFDGNSGTGGGIWFDSNNSQVDQIFFWNLKMDNVGAQSIYLPSAFSVNLSDMYLNSTNNNVVEVDGSVTTLTNIYVVNVGTGKAAYRIYEGRATLRGCNGIDSGTTADWGVFGRTVAEDGIDSYAFVELIGSNIETFTRYGVRLKANSLASFYGTSIHGNAGVLQAIRFESPSSGGLGVFDGLSTIDAPGGTWTNGIPIHTNSNDPAPLLVYATINSLATQTYAEGLSAAVDNMVVTQTSCASSTTCISYKNAEVTNLSRFRSGATLQLDAGSNLTGLTAAMLPTVTIAKGGTGQVTKAAGFDALSPMTTAGDITYGGASGTGTRLATGTAKQILIAGTTPSYITFPDFKYFDAVNCVNSVAGSGFSTTGSTPTPTCRAGTNNKNGYLSFGASDVASFEVAIPNDWDGTNINLSLDVSSSDATNNHTIIMQVASACQKPDGSTTDDVAYNTAQSFSTVTLNGNANRSWQATLSTQTITGCAAGSVLREKLTRTTDTATDVKIWGVGLTLPRLLTVAAN